MKALVSGRDAGSIVPTVGEQMYSLHRTHWSYNETAQFSICLSLPLPLFLALSNAVRPLLDRNEFDIEHQGRTARDHTAGASIAISQRGRDGQRPLLANTHVL